MDTAKKLIYGIGTLTMGLIVVAVFWRFMKKVPGVGGVADKVDNLMHEGTL